ncbi:RNA helicase [Physocladia obscura]|uniref:RNA helicase n=1 Tax=Physocladia obscura TaxID=109957 RepID=A0AAD5SYU9_9FUNG|nr:RNA helicase [Physocladia obscura]
MEAEQKGNNLLNTPANLSEIARELLSSETIKRKCKDLGLQYADAQPLIEEYATAVRADELPYMRKSVVEDAMRDEKPIDRFLLPGLYQFILDTKKDLVDAPNFRTLMTLSDLRTPSEWFPQARAMKRKIIMHVGPTNSGKTYSALKCFEKAETGAYAGPLRLLAHDVYEKLNNNGASCNLLTGEERRESDNVYKWSCTVEMTPLNRNLDIAVIDEIQMISDEQRGWAWTNALLGACAKEVHLCGEATAVPLVKRICALMGEEVTVHTYNRLTPLHIEVKGNGSSFSNIQPGDCVVTFSRKNIFAIRKKIEGFATMKAAVIYGSLPPETRAEQAKLFNDPNNNHRILVASDAIGMGLNLNIRRIVFETVSKFNGKRTVPLTVSQIKQIAGRAGRFKTQYPIGTVSTLHNGDMAAVRRALGVENPPPLPSAGIHPSLEQIQSLADELPNETFAGLLDQFEQLSRLDGDFFLCNLHQQKDIANLIQSIELSLSDRYTLVNAPASADEGILSEAFVRFATCVSTGEECNLKDYVTLPHAPAQSSELLKVLEAHHKVILLYLWLSYRFPSIFSDSDTASHLKRVCEDLINSSLDKLHDPRVKQKVDSGKSWGKKQFEKRKTVNINEWPSFLEKKKNKLLHKLEERESMT